MVEKLELLLLIVAANGTPILLDDLLGHRWAWPADAGSLFADGRRLLGRSVTIRGLVLAPVATACVAALLGHSAAVGMLVGMTAMLGDAGSSFVKRRLGLAPGDRALGLDQIPESLLPLLVVKGDYGLGWWDLALLVLAFVLVDVLVSRILYRLHLRKRPH